MASKASVGMTGAPGRLIIEAYREALAKGSGVGRLPVVSDSMRPRLQVGDIIEFSNVPLRSLMPGDIVVVMNAHDAGIDVHRLVWRRPLLGAPRTVFTKGDARPRLDFAARADQVLGRVTTIHRGDARLSPATTRDRLRCVWIAAQHGVGRLLRPRRQVAV